MIIYDALVISYDLRGMLMRVVIVIVNRPDEDQSVWCSGCIREETTLLHMYKNVALCPGQQNRSRLRFCCSVCIV